MKTTAERAGSCLGAIARLMTIVFVTLRACDVITWEWYWILSPYTLVLVSILIAYAIKGAQK